MLTKQFSVEKFEEFFKGPFLQSMQKMFQDIAKSFNSPLVMNLIYNGEQIVKVSDLDHPTCSFPLKNKDGTINKRCNKPAKHFYTNNESKLVVLRCKEHRSKVMNLKTSYMKVTLDELKVLQIMQE